MTITDIPLGHKRASELEAKHFGRCIAQVWTDHRRRLVQLMDYPKAGCTAIVVKRFEHPVPPAGSRKPWPDLARCEVYLPITDDYSWDGLDTALTKAEQRS